MAVKPALTQIWGHVDYSAMKLFCFFLALFLQLIAFSSRAQTSSITWKGAFVLWQRPACDSLLNCDSPQAMSTAIPVEVQFSVPQSEGKHLVVQQTWTFEKWNLDVEMIWVNASPSSTQSAYVVSQFRLKESNLGVVAECTRYDGASELLFLPPGSCSGRVQNKMIGFSILSPSSIAQ